MHRERDREKIICLYIYKDRARYVERKSERERERDVAYTGNHYLSYVCTHR